MRGWACEKRSLCLWMQRKPFSHFWFHSHPRRHCGHHFATPCATLTDAVPVPVHCISTHTHTNQKLRVSWQHAQSPQSVFKLSAFFFHVATIPRLKQFGGMHRFHHRNIDQFQNAFTGMFLLQTVELYIVMCNGLSQRNQQLQLHGTTLGNPSDKTRGNCSPKCSQGITFEVPRETLSTGHFLCIADTVKFQGLLVFEFLCFARSLSSVSSEHSEIIPKRQFVKSHQLQIAWLEVKIALKLLEQA